MRRPCGLAIIVALTPRASPKLSVPAPAPDRAESAMADLVLDPDGTARCWWCGDDPLYRAYHDDEWGRESAATTRCSSCSRWRASRPASRGSRSCVSGRASGRLRRILDRAGRRFDERDVERLLGDAGIIRHRGKIEATIGNAVAALELPTGLSELVWSFAPPRRSVRPSVAASCRRDARVDRALEGAEAPRLPVCRPDHGLCLHAVGRLRRRPSRWAATSRTAAG